MSRIGRTLALSVLLVPGVALAHHGQDFLLLESPGVPHPGNAYLLVNAGADLSGKAGEQASFAPALFVGVTKRVALELHSHFDKPNGEAWESEAVAPSVHILLTDPDRHHGLKVGVSVEHEIALHRGEPDNTELRLSAENGSMRDKWAGNLIAAREQGGETQYGIALGFKHAISDSVAIGAEGEHALGSTHDDSVLGGVYFERGQKWAVKAGLGAQKTDGGHFEPMVRVGLVLQLRG